MPRSFSSSIQSLVACRRARLAFTLPARWMAPPYNRSFSVSVVLPASGWLMMAKVRRRATSRSSSVLILTARLPQPAQNTAAGATPDGDPGRSLGYFLPLQVYRPSPVGMSPGTASGSVLGAPASGAVLITSLSVSSGTSARPAPGRQLESWPAMDTWVQLGRPVAASRVQDSTILKPSASCASQQAKPRYQVPAAMSPPQARITPAPPTPGRYRTRRATVSLAAVAVESMLTFAAMRTPVAPEGSSLWPTNAASSGSCWVASGVKPRRRYASDFASSVPAAFSTWAKAASILPWPLNEEPSTVFRLSRLVPMTPRPWCGSAPRAMPPAMTIRYAVSSAPTGLASSFHAYLLTSIRFTVSR